MRNNYDFKTTTFCIMNQDEKLCRRYKADVECFRKIPYRFEFDGSVAEKSCSVIFPPGYSIYIEEFILNDPGPDNFVVVDGQALEYRSKLKWTDREQSLWTKLHENHPLNRKSNRRFNIPCVKTLKVSEYLVTS